MEDVVGLYNEGENRAFTGVGVECLRHQHKSARLVQKIEDKRVLNVQMNEEFEKMNRDEMYTQWQILYAESDDGASSTTHPTVCSDNDNE